MNIETTHALYEDWVLYPIYKDDIQGVAVSNFGRELTEKELKRLPTLFLQHDEFNGLLREALMVVARDVMTDAESWERFDEEHKNIPLEDLLDCVYIGSEIDLPTA